MDFPIPNKKTHEGVDFPGSLFDMEECKVGIEDAEENNQEKGDEEVMAVTVDIQMAFPIRFSSNGLTAPGKEVFNGRSRWFLTSIPEDSSVFSELDHIHLRSWLAKTIPRNQKVAQNRLRESVGLLIENLN